MGLGHLQLALGYVAIGLVRTTPLRKKTGALTSPGWGLGAPHLGAPQGVVLRGFRTRYLQGVC